MRLSKCDALTAATPPDCGYTNAFKHLPALRVPSVRNDRTSAWHLYVLRLHLDRLPISRDQVIEMLRERGIGTSVHFIPLHLHPFYRSAYGYKPRDLPQAERGYERCLSLPIYPS